MWIAIKVDSPGGRYWYLLGLFPGWRTPQFFRV